MFGLRGNVKKRKRKNKKVKEKENFKSIIAYTTLNNKTKDEKYNFP